MKNLLLTERTKKSLKFSAVCVVVVVIFIVLCFSGNKREEVRTEEGEPGDEQEAIDLVSYVFPETTYFHHLDNSFLYSDGVLLINNVSKRVKSIFFDFQVMGNCSCKDLTLFFEFSGHTNKKISVTLPKFVGAQRYKLHVECPKDAVGWRLAGVLYRPADYSLEACRFFGDDMRLELEGVNTLRYKCNKDVLVFDKDGAVINYLELRGKGTEVISPGAKYYRFLVGE